MCPLRRAGVPLGCIGLMALSSVHDEPDRHHADTDAAVAHLREHETEHFAQLDEFLRIESVSADPGTRRRGAPNRAVDRG